MLLSTPPRSPLLTPLNALLVVPAVALLIAYLWAKSQRPQVEDWLQLQNPGKFGFPAWYGKGETPHDHRSDGQDEACEVKKDITLFIDLPYNSTHIPTALTTLRALSRHPDYNLRAVSPFSPGWHASLSVGSNLKAVDGCVGTIWRIADEPMTEEESAWEGCRNQTIISEILSESGLPPSDPKANITILPQPHHLVDSSLSYETLDAQHGPKGWEMGLYAHVLPAADPEIYNPQKRLSDRRSVTYFPRPSTPKSDWPKRPWGRSWTIYQARSKVPAPRVGEDALGPDSSWSKWWRGEEQRRAAAMRSSGICMFEGWEQGLLDVNIVQAMASGCVVAMAPMEVERETLLPLIIPLSRHAAPAEELKRVLQDVSDDELKRKALRGFVVVRQMFTPQKRFDEVQNVIKRWSDGGRGYLFPHPWRWTCEGPFKPAWCSDKGP